MRKTDRVIQGQLRASLFKTNYYVTHSEYVLRNLQIALRNLRISDCVGNLQIACAF